MSTNSRFPALNAFLFGQPEDFFVRFAELEVAQVPLRNTFLAFRANIQSAITVANMPYVIAHTAILDSRFQQLHSAESIRGLAKSSAGAGLTDEAKSDALSAARSRMDMEMADPDIIKKHAESTLNLLDRHLKEEKFAAASQDLLRQVLVMSWSAFEVFANDILREIMNANPKLISRFADVKPYKEVLSPRLFLEAMSGRNYDLSSAMGDIFCDAVRLDSIEKIRDALAIAVGDPTLEEQLKDTRIWLLFQQRNLIVHRRGIKDARFLSRTTDNGTLGEQILLNGDYIDSLLELVRDIGCALYSAVLDKFYPATD